MILSEELLTNKADSERKTNQTDESQDDLLEEIAQPLEETERTEDAVAQKLAEIAKLTVAIKAQGQRAEKEAWKISSTIQLR